jgi:hypothetical protein
LGGFGYGLGKYSSFSGSGIGAGSSARFSTPFNAADRLSGYRDIMDDPRIPRVQFINGHSNAHNGHKTVYLISCLEEYREIIRPVLDRILNEHFEHLLQQRTLTSRAYGRR